jgi:hypothetical protein
MLQVRLQRSATLLLVAPAPAFLKIAVQTLIVKIEQFEVEEWIAGRGPAAVFYVNGCALPEYLGRAHPDILLPGSSRSPYGRWIGVETRYVLPPSQNYLGHPDDVFMDYGWRVPIAACCECGMHGCDGIWTRVKFEETVVRWTDFILNPILNPVPLQTGDLVFDAAQYRAAFASLV